MGDYAGSSDCARAAAARHRYTTRGVREFAPPPPGRVLTSRDEIPCNAPARSIPPATVCVKPIPYPLTSSRHAHPCRAPAASAACVERQVRARVTRPTPFTGSPCAARVQALRGVALTPRKPASPAREPAPCRGCACVSPLALWRAIRLSTMRTVFQLRLSGSRNVEQIRMPVRHPAILQAVAQRFLASSRGATGALHAQASPKRAGTPTRTLRR